jgi:hypothetical protein
MAGAGGPVSCNVENSCAVGDFGHHCDGDQEDEDGTHPDRKVGKDRPSTASHWIDASRIHGWPGRAGLVIIVSKR